MLIVGAGGFAVEVMEILNKQEDISNLCFYDDINADTPDYLFDQFSVIKSLNAAKEHFNKGDNRFTVGMGNPLLRKKMAEQFEAIGGKLTSVVSEDATIADHQVKMAAGCIIMPGVRISPRVSIGRGSMIYYNTVITHDVEIGEFCEISPSVNILGGASIDGQCHLATGSIIFPKMKIGSQAVIGAGAVVKSNVPPCSVAVGVPAKVISQKR